MTTEEISKKLRELDRHINELERGILNDRLAKDKILKLNALKNAVFQQAALMSTYNTLLNIQLESLAPAK